LKNTINRNEGLFKTDWNFENMNIGGLNKEFKELFRRAFVSRIYSSEVIAKLGIKHVKGILLYGPAGTGKTLIARELSKMLNSKEPKIINGPEILNKFVGESEGKIRELFRPAEDDYKRYGDKSELHVIIFDEFDSLAVARGSHTGSTGVNDSIVTQILAKMDGVESLNNILIIGMTNRIDIIDSALLRPGRFELNLEISLPNEQGRLEILNIHTATMRKNKNLAEDVNLVELAAQTKNFTGAELEGLIRPATSFSLNRNIPDLKKLKDLPKDVMVLKSDFEQALDEVKPAYGVHETELNNRAPYGIIEFSAPVRENKIKIKSFLEQLKVSKFSLFNLCFKGDVGSGKTALACQMALESGFPYIRLLSAELFSGEPDLMKTHKIKRMFEEAYKSSLSLIILDDLEQLIEYVSIGPRFSNPVLQTLINCLKQNPPSGHKLFTILTTSLGSEGNLLSDLGLGKLFSATIELPNITNMKEFCEIISTQFEITSEYKEEIMKLTSRKKVKSIISFAEDGEMLLEYQIKEILLGLENIKYESKDLIEGLKEVFILES